VACEDSVFEIKLDLSGSVAEGDVYWFRTTLKPDSVKVLEADSAMVIEADSAQFKRDFKLQDCVIDGLLFLYASTIGKHLLLEDLDTHDSFFCDLRYAKVGILQDDENSWPKPGNLRLEGLIYDEIYELSPRNANTRLPWLRLEYEDYPRTAWDWMKRLWSYPTYEFSRQPYIQLATVLQSQGYARDTINILIAQEKDHRILSDLSLVAKFWHDIKGLIIAYGYKPYRALFIALVLVIFGAFIFGEGYDQQPKLITPSRVRPFVSPTSSTPASPSSATSTASPLSGQPEPPVQELYPRFNALVYSLDVFVPIVDFQQRAYWLPNANRGDEEVVPILGFEYQAGARLRLYFWIHTGAGWVLTSLWAAGFTGLIRRID
jgi:hypothetical protein